MTMIMIVICIVICNDDHGVNDGGVDDADATDYDKFIPGGPCTDSSFQT